jgi:deazaflavin-dependent oxidoreductase (nitroreductase family)
MGVTQMSDAKVSEKLPDWVKDHVRRYLASNGADGHMITLPNAAAPVPTLLLTTTGRVSGEKFLFPLIYATTGNSYAIIASKGGAPEHPGWYQNIEKTPEVELQVKDEVFRARARTAKGEERERLWRLANTVWRQYDDYAKKTEREIPVVVLERI